MKVNFGSVELNFEERTISRFVVHGKSIRKAERKGIQKHTIAASRGWRGWCSSSTTFVIANRCLTWPIATMYASRFSVSFLCRDASSRRRLCSGEVRCTRSRTAETQEAHGLQRTTCCFVRDSRNPASPPSSQIRKLICYVLKRILSQNSYFSLDVKNFR